MNERVRQAADAFLAHTYGFDPHSRGAIIDRAEKEIVADCRELVANVSTDSVSTGRRAHRLKGHLLALGLAALAERANAVEHLAAQGTGCELTDAVRSLCRDVLRHPPQ